ncbi:LysE family translocator [Bradyrhizobium sp. LHD-71]|uniref:LysE family translocator n=1 Tax=Bradyrhizobium sp. LHD-71 TaxID=3072141 RepID=UPI0028105E9A|nr:LysE family translocator [Bradyrhizobium sp. LHD-71]MDQ8727865.1 LysE family translocator [Bradyrhizobium sp. LHD-71]
MSQQLIIAFVLFAVASCFTPGPNNTMLLTSGLNFGFRRTLPHMLGVTFGFGFLVAVMGLWLGAIFATYPSLYTVLKYVGAAYLLYLAWAIATSGGVDDKGEKRGRPLSFFGGAVFQWVNVKGLIMSAGAVTTYSAIAPYPYNIIALSLIFTLVGFFSSASWTLFGSSLRGLLSTPRAVRIFNVTMALLLVASLYPVLFEA